MLPPAVVRSKYRQRSVPQEQTFIPKVQVYFADFPYSHCSTKLEVISFGDLLRFLVRLGQHTRKFDHTWFFLDFIETPRKAGFALKISPFLSLINGFQGRTTTTPSEDGFI